MVGPATAAERRATVIGAGPADHQEGQGGILVVGVDGTPTGDAALAWTLAEARCRHATVEVVLARTIEVAAAAQVSLDGLTDDRARQLVARSLERVGGARGVPIDVVTVADEPFLEMELESRDRQAGMTVIGNHPRSRIHDLLRGFPLSLLSRAGQNPLVVVPVGFRRRPPGHLVVASTSSERGVAALRWAVGEAALLGASLRAVHVIPSRQDGDARSVHLAATRRSLVETHRLIDLITTPGLEASARVASGPLPGVLVNEAATAELLVVGAPAHVRLSELTHQSVLRTVLATSRVPVVVVPIPALPPAGFSAEATTVP
jgi:nucleotide-binding universal stress UspA family protein